MRLVYKRVENTVSRQFYVHNALESIILTHYKWLWQSLDKRNCSLAPELHKIDKNCEDWAVVKRGSKCDRNKRDEVNVQEVWSSKRVVNLVQIANRQVHRQIKRKLVQWQHSRQLLVSVFHFFWFFFEINFVLFFNFVLQFSNFENFKKKN